MNLFVLNKIVVKPREFVDFWSGFYDDPLEGYYVPVIGKKRFSDEDLVKLFEWKNGSKLAQKKKKVLGSMIANLGKINALKASFCLDTFLEEFKFIKGAIWKIFLLHVIQPDKFPIFDQHVYRAYLFISKHQRAEIPNNNKRKEAAYFSEYVSFFNGLSVNGISKKKLDEALWAYGKFLKTPYGRKVWKSWDT